MEFDKMTRNIRKFKTITGDQSLKRLVASDFKQRCDRCDLGIAIGNAARVARTRSTRRHTFPICQV